MEIKKKAFNNKNNNINIKNKKKYFKKLNI